MPFIDFNTKRKIKIWEGISGAVFHSEQATCGHFTIEAGIDLPEHSHPHEQWSHLIEGQLEFNIKNKMRPLDIPTSETLEFVQAHLPSAPARILEIGCGNGELAQRLQVLGHQIIGIDSSPEAVREARQLGVDARIAQWPEFEEKPFDAILFTRSLHHIHHLNEAIEKAASLLKPSGRIIVEDFAFDEIGRATVEWFYGVLALLNACGRLNLDDEDSFGKAMISKAMPLPRKFSRSKKDWRRRARSS